MPNIARIKTELQCHGVRVPEELIAEIEGAYNTAPDMRRGRMIFYLQPPGSSGRLVPVFVLNSKYTEDTPYHLVKSGEEYAIWRDNAKYTSITLMPRPKYYYPVPLIVSDKGVSIFHVHLC